MLAPHFKDEIAGLQKWLFLAGFDLFWCSFFIVTHIYGQTMYILQKNVPRCHFLAAGRPQTFHTPLLNGPHRLLNWQIQVTRVSWVIGQSTKSLVPKY